MATNKFFKSLLIALTIGINSFGFCIQESSAYPVFAQQNYSNPRAANGKIACANCHLNQKAIEIEAPQAVLPNSVFEIEINSVTDNPTIFIEEDEIISGGNFHGQPLALALDFLCIAMAELANISERRIYLLFFF